MKLKFGNVEEGYITGLVGRDEGQRLAELAADVAPPQVIVEIGSQGGSSTSWLAMGAAKGASAQLYAIDLWSDEEMHGRVAKHAEQAVRRRFDAQISYIASAGYIDPAKVTAIQGESTAEATAWPEPIGLLHIDALHTYEACSADIDAWTPHLVEGGVVVVHDYYDPRFGVRKAVDERLRGPEWKTIEIPRWEQRRNRRGQFIARKVGATLTPAALGRSVLGPQKGKLGRR